MREYVVASSRAVLQGNTCTKIILVIDRRLARLCSLDLLVLDDFGLRPLSVQAAEDLYELIRERYERKSTVITSNRSFEEWPEVFGDGLLSSAALDRLSHHCHIR